MIITVVTKGYTYIITDPEEVTIATRNEGIIFNAEPDDFSDSTIFRLQTNKENDTWTTTTTEP